MPNNNAYFESHPGNAERRIHTRHPISTLEYVELDEGNGGIILNASIGGLSVQAVTSLMDDLLPVVRFRPTRSRDWIETSARIAWADESRKMAGLEFQNLSDHTRIQIKNWLSNGVPASQFPSDPDHETERPSSTPVSILQNRSANKPELPIIAAGPVPQNVSAIHAVQKGASAERSTPAAPERSPSAGDAFGTTFGSSFGQARETRREPNAGNRESAEEPTRTSNHPALIAVLAVLAVVSLVIGWEAGHGALDRGFRILLNTMSPNKSVGTAPTQNLLRPATEITEIEIVDASGQRWAILFNGSIGTPATPTSLSASSGSVPPTPKSPPAFQTWVLSPPVHTSNNASSTSLNDKEAPPAVGDISNPEDRLSPPSGLTSSASPPPPVVTRAALKPGILIYRVDPIYPKLAQEHSITGTVNLRVTVAEDGTVRDIEVVNGLGVFMEAATSAVRRWRYTPALLDGKPVEMVREISLVFRPPPTPR